ncbi:MAG TPA: hypothetical protein VK421_01935 [Pyrinomonadaceae bacterium]|nr:hypothetical protein [Pyrinomonadaceae bacterium]
MNDSHSPPIISPDGRFEVVVETTTDRFEVLYDTVLRDRVSGERLFECPGTPRAEFSADGTLTIDTSGSDQRVIQIDLAGRAFRTSGNEPWLPLAAWRGLEAAYRRGWADGLNFRTVGKGAVFPWVTTALLAGSILLLLVLSVQPLLDGAARAVLLALGGVGVLFFGWLAAGDISAWALLRKLRRTPWPRG